MCLTCDSDRELRSIVEKMVEVPIDRIIEKKVIQEIEVPRVVINEVPVVSWSRSFVCTSKDRVV